MKHSKVGCDWQVLQFSQQQNGINVLGVVNDKRHRPEKQQLCLFEVSAGFSFLEGFFCALDRIFLTPLITHVW